MLRDENSSTRFPDATRLPDAKRALDESNAGSSMAVQRLTIALASASVAVGVTAVAVDLEPRWQVFVWLAFGVAAVVVGGWIGAKLSVERVASVAPVAVLLGYLANIALEPLMRLAGTGRPLELVLYEGLLVTLPVFAFAAVVRRWLALAGTACLFAVLFAVCLLSSPVVALLTVVWVVVGVMWLLAFARSRSAGEVIVQQTSGRRWAVPLGLFVVVGVIASFSTGRESLSLAQGFLSSSGGDGEGSEYARDGVGDGDALVAATTQAESFGPIEDAPFARSDEPSLYDLFDDTYGDPCKVKKSDKAVSLSPEDVLEGENKMAEAEAAGREFSTLRRPRTELRGGVDDLASTALFYLAGRVPLHLRMKVFQDFDGIEWREALPRTNHRPEVVFESHDDKPWLIVPQPSHAFEKILSKPEAHALKPVHFGGTRIPLPPNATGVHIHQVDREHLFEWVQEDIVQMTRKRLPKLVPIHLMSRRVDEDVIDKSLASVGAGPHELHALPAVEGVAEIRRLAEEWTAETESGWAEIHLVVERLKQRCVLDADATVSPDSKFPAADFLFGSKRGPDYQFATAACLLLRSLGYSTRLVAGFYADDTKYDSVGRHTPIDGDDVHTWCEVRLGGDCWATIEPTPGYAVLAPPRSLWYRLKQAVSGAFAAAIDAWRFFVGLAVVVALVFWRREDVSDAIETTYVTATGRAQDPVIAWRLVERRLDRVLPAPAGWTPRHRLKQLPVSEDLRAELNALITEAEAGAFARAQSASTGTEASPETTSADVSVGGAGRATAMMKDTSPVEIIRQVSLRRLRQIRSEMTPGAAA